jgi:hypothetical protein
MEFNRQTENRGLWKTKEKCKLSLDGRLDYKEVSE